MTDEKDPKQEDQEKHIHKLIRQLIGGRKIVKKDGKRYIEKCGGTEIMKCMSPGCNYYILFELAEGKESRCWNCNGRIILNKENLRLVKPTHGYCRKMRDIA